jgi:hypothetical protein
MHIDREMKIRERAYALWEEEGRFEGRAQDHWYRAERELAAFAAAPAVKAPASPKRRAPTAVKAGVVAKAKRAAKPQVLHS